ncbi:MAG: universal stress protein [Spirulina sp. SIO3F2]|nr:universal stress protein [Spirulina sp. SIO3F2]
MFKRYLICTDLVDGLQRLTAFIPALAQAGGQQFVFTHTVPIWAEGDIPRLDEAKIAEAQTVLDAALAHQGEGREVIVDIQSGKPQDMIPKLVQKYNSDVVLMGTATRSLIQETIFGSNSLAIARSTAVPLMLLRPQLINTYTQAELTLRCQNLWRYLLIPYSGSESAKYLLEQLKATVQAAGANAPQKCLLLTVVSETKRKGISSDYQQQAAAEQLAQAEAELASCGIEVTTEVRVGDPMQEITHAAIKHDITAIAIAHVSRSALLELTAPSFANEILRHSWFPVLFFSPKG